MEWLLHYRRSDSSNFLLRIKVTEDICTSVLPMSSTARNVFLLTLARGGGTEEEKKKKPIKSQVACFKPTQ